MLKLAALLIRRPSRHTILALPTTIGREVVTPDDVGCVRVQIALEHFEPVESSETEVVLGQHPGDRVGDDLGFRNASRSFSNQGKGEEEWEKKKRTNVFGTSLHDKFVVLVL